jgi:hypothetical protein
MKKIYLTIAILITNIVLSQTLVKPVFEYFNTGQVFSAITVDKNNNVWAGTDRAGAFFLNQSQTNPSFSQLTIGVQNFELSKLRIQSMASDGLGNVWVAHAGSTGTFNGGGLERVDINSLTAQHFTPDRNAKGFQFLERDGTATLNAQQVAVSKDNTVWVAQRYHDLLVSGMDPVFDPLTGTFTNFPAAYYITPGTFSFRKAGQEKFISKSTWKDKDFTSLLPYPAYTYNPPINKTGQTRTFNAISADSTSVWTSVYPYIGAADTQDTEGQSYPSRILKCDLNGNIIQAFTKTDANFRALGGVFSGVYANDSKGIWATSSLVDEGFSVYFKGIWINLTSVNFPDIIPTGTRFNTRAIWGNQYGNVFMGTNNGLIVYDGRGPVDKETSYTLYNQELHGLISNNIIAGATETITDDSPEELDYKLTQWIATDKGIIKANIGAVPSDSDSSLPEPSKNSDVKLVEEEIKTRATKNDPTYHEYFLETEICDTKKKYGATCPCTKEKVYEYVAKNVKYQAVHPYVFNRDIINPALLASLNDSDLNQIYQIVNEQKDSIEYASKIFDIAGARGNIKFAIDSKLRKSTPGFILGSVAGFVNNLFVKSTDELYKIQIGINPKKCITNTRYKLYNSENNINMRRAFKEVVNNAHYAPIPLPFPPFLTPFKVKVPKACNPSDFVESDEYDSITLWIDDKDFSMTNYTNKGHFLHPGYVKRKIIVKDDGKVYVVTEGKGYHFCNTPDGDKLSALMSKTAKGINVIVGSIMFKNIDINLKNAFTNEK